MATTIRLKSVGEKQLLLVGGIFSSFYFSQNLLQTFNVSPHGIALSFQKADLECQRPRLWPMTTSHHEQTRSELLMILLSTPRSKSNIRDGFSALYLIFFLLLLKACWDSEMFTLSIFLHDLSFYMFIDKNSKGLTLLLMQLIQNCLMMLRGTTGKEDSLFIYS